MIPPPPHGPAWRVGLYWVYAVLLASASIFWLAVVSPIIRPTLPSYPEHLLFCIFAGTCIADAAAHALSDIARIWKPHDLGGAKETRRRFHVRKLILADLRALFSQLTAAPVVAMMALSYTLLSPHIQDKLFGHAAGQGPVFWTFMSQCVLGALDIFAFFLSRETKATLSASLGLAELSPASFEAGAILAGLKLYGVLILVSTLRIAGAPVVIFRTWTANRKRRQFSRDRQDK